MPKHTQLINNSILNRVIESAYIPDRKTYSSAESYQLVLKYNDTRYEYAFRTDKRWPGAAHWTNWVTTDKLPLVICGHRQDYGQGLNKLIIQNPNLFLNPEIKDEYERYHLPHRDHFPIPESLNGPTTYDNCKIRTNSSNVMRGNNKDDDQLTDSILLLIEEFNLKDVVALKLNNRKLF
jgi:hypothetical protein